MKRIANYELLETLGQGPFGNVYRAQESPSLREVALKILTLSLSDMDSLLRDLNATNCIQASLTLRHTSIIRVHRIDSSASQILIEMDYLRGFNLRELLNFSGILPPQKALEIASALLSALSYAHKRGALHRDIKPENVFLTRTGEIKLSDFGAAQTAKTCITTGAQPTYAYASPEELASVPTVDIRSDLWSVGVLLYEMLTGKLPFPIAPNESLANARQIQRASPLPPLPKEINDRHPALASALKRALSKEKGSEKEPGFHSAQVFLKALQEEEVSQQLSSVTAKNRETRARALYSKMSGRMRESLGTAPKAELQEVIREFAVKNPNWEDGGSLIHYARFLDAPHKHAGSDGIDLTPEELSHIEDIAARLRPHPSPTKIEISLREPFNAPAEIYPAHFLKDLPSLERLFETEDALAGFEEEDLFALRKTETEILLNPKDGAELIFIPEGYFQMGSDGYSEDNSPLRHISLDAFCIYRHPVTVSQFQSFCKETGHLMPPIFWELHHSHPIVGVSWGDAFAYSEWANAALPTEAQWEKAARGTDGRAFAWGDQFDQRSDHRILARNAGRTVQVGRHPLGASPYGVLDCAGNIQQWCCDLYSDDYYKTSPLANPPGPLIGKRQRVAKSGLVHRIFNPETPQKKKPKLEHRVVRGSSWKDYHESYSFTFRRDALPPDLHLPWVGFRCVTKFVG